MSDFIRFIGSSTAGRRFATIPNLLFGSALAVALGWAPRAVAQCNWTAGTAKVTETCGNVGIGTSTPTQKLTLGAGHMLFDNAYGLLSASGAAIKTGTGGLTWGIYPGATGNIFGAFTYSGTQAFVIGATGNVGIGSQSPPFRLDLGGSPRLAFDPTTSTPDATTLLFGDGTGWKLHIGKRSDSGATKFVTFQDNGNVGIGTTTPSHALTLGSGKFVKVQIDPGNDTGTGSAGYVWSAREAGGYTHNWVIYTSPTAGSPGLTPNSFSLYDYPGNPGTGPCCNQRLLILPGPNGAAAPKTLFIDASGNVGIGVTPTQALDVAGNINVSGNIAAKYQDVAEWVPARERLQPGAVVVLDRLLDKGVMPSDRPYDTRVAGVVSAEPGIILGEAGNGKVKVATTGRVKVSVDARNAPIEIGDLLVTSGTPGTAMRSEPLDLGGVPIHRPGTLIGKALEPLESGQGEILVLLSLQ